VLAREREREKERAEGGKIEEVHSRLLMQIWRLKVRFHNHIFATNLLTNLLAKLPHKQMMHNFFMFVSQKFVANTICLPQTQLCEFVSEFLTKFVAKM
jgi:hypothetical protein